MARLELKQADAANPQEQDQEPHQEKHLEGPTLLRPEIVDRAEEHREPPRDRTHRETREEELQVRTDAYERECALQDDRDPGAESADRPYERTHAPVQEIVDATRPRHGGRQLHQTEQPG